MESNNSSFLKISRDELGEFSRQVDSVLKVVDWKSTKVNFANTSKEKLDAIHSLILGGNEVKLSFYQSALDISNTGLAMSESVNKVAITLRDALMVASKVADYYEKTSNMDNIKKEKSQSTDRQLEFRKKNNTAAAVFDFTVASYMLYELSQHRASDVESVKLEFNGIPELDLTNVPKARKCMIFYYVAYLSKSGYVRNDLDFLKMSILYFQSIVDEIHLKIDSLEYKDIFTSRSYKLEDSEFVVEGFALNNLSAAKSVDFNKVQWTDIVGNTESKHSAKRSIMSLMCYDPETNRNPMKDLGGFFRTKLTYGPPGTGKSMEIAAIATELCERCKELGIPFLFHPFPDNIVSTFQGGSAERMIEWMKPLSDTSKIVFAPIDDAENNLEERSNQGVSAGVQEVIGVFLRMTEGAYAIDYGNNLINMYTNLPEKIDKAVLSRVQARTQMDGAVTPEDFMDQDYIGLIKPLKNLISDGFVDIIDPKSYNYMSSQNIAEKVAMTYKDKSNSKVEKVAKAIEQIKSRYDVNSPEFFAHLDAHMHKEFIYTSRDKRNIQSAVKTRIFDFDFDPRWLENPELFFRKDYDTKKAMIIELMKSSLGGKSFAEIYFEESVFYFDNLAQISDKEFERQVKAGIESEKIRREITKRLQQG